MKALKGKKYQLYTKAFDPFKDYEFCITGGIITDSVITDGAVFIIIDGSQWERFTIERIKEIRVIEQDAEYQVIFKDNSYFRIYIKQPKITEKDIKEIKTEKMFDIFKVKRVINELYTIYGYEYGTEIKLHAGYAKDIAEWLNSYFGISE